MLIVNFGCGDSIDPERVNVDGSLTVLLAKAIPFPSWIFGTRRSAFVDAIRNNQVRFGRASTFAMEPQSIDGFYASHVLGHLARRECEDLLKRVRTMLRPGGILRVVLPDLLRLAKSYANGEIDCDTFVERSKLSGDEMPAWRLATSLSRHRWGYDFPSFSRVLEQSGYHNIVKSEFGKGSPLARLDLPARASESFYVEANP